MSRKIEVAADADMLGRAAADLIVQRAQQAEGRFAIALSGGNTPRRLYETLASEPWRSQMPWQGTQVFFSDERFVPPDSPDSNYYLAEQTLLSRVPISSRFVHRVPTVDIDPEDAAALYEGNIRDVFRAPLTATPQFDLILLGMGADGHTASLFPGTPALQIEDRLVAANHVPQAGMWRITFTYRLLNAARCVVFLVEGESKAGVLRQVLQEGDLPAASVAPAGDLIWMIDRAAASQLPPSLLP
ncbi:MAG TPA: 6-phosphogluconolactonase [Chloroflexota bacterium]|nr:6-phosphogluconolactonase [Chloroflexota bacterium]